MLAAQQSCFTWGPSSARPRQCPTWEASRSAHTLTHTGLTLAQAETWHGPLGGRQRLWLSCHSCH